MRTRVQQVFGEGLITGIIGYGAVVLFFAGQNLLAGQSPFHTPAVLGAPLVQGTPADQEVVAAVFAYNGLHLLVFIVVGMMAAWIVTRIERQPSLWYLGFFVFFLIFAYDLVLLLMVTGPEGEPGWASILAANGLAVLAMGGYLWAIHRGLWEEIRQRGDPEETADPPTPS
ncbi:MAG: hypothetical protein ACOC5J_00415 [Gemmatimonadota bacterium]